MEDTSETVAPASGPADQDWSARQDQAPTAREEGDASDCVSDEQTGAAGAPAEEEREGSDREDASSEDASSGDVTEEELELLRREAEDARREFKNVQLQLAAGVEIVEDQAALSVQGGDLAGMTEADAAAAAEGRDSLEDQAVTLSTQGGDITGMTEAEAAAAAEILEKTAAEARAAAAEAAAAAAREEAEEAASTIFEVCLAPALEKIELRVEALEQAKEALEMLLTPALNMEAAAIAQALATARAERAAARAAAKAAAEEAARARRIDPPAEDYPHGAKPADCVETGDLIGLGSSPKRQTELDALQREVSLRAGRTLSWGAPRQGKPAEAVYGAAASTPVTDLVEQEKEWLKLCSRQMMASVADRLRSNRNDFEARLPDAAQVAGSMASGCVTGSSSRPFLAPHKQAVFVEAHCRKIQRKEDELRGMRKRLASLASGMPFLREQIHAGSRVMGQYDQSAREIKILESLIHLREQELSRLRSSNPVLPAPAIVALSKDRAEHLAEGARFGLQQQIAASTRSLAQAQQQVSYLACSLRSKDVIVRSGKTIHVETERDAFASKYCERPHSALREMTRLSQVQAEALALSNRVCLLQARQRVGLLAVAKEL